MRFTWLAVAVLLLAGCVEPSDPEPGAGAAGCPDALGFWVPGGKDNAAIKVDGALRSDVLGFFPKSAQTRITSFDLPDRWKWEIEQIGPTDDNATFVRIGITSVGVGMGGMRDPARAPALAKPITANWTTGLVEDCPERWDGNSWRVLAAGSGKNVQPGDGVAVYYAGFWLNGTLFSTNIAGVDQSSWPRGGWYTSGENKPLNVYVYDKDRSEMTPQWSPRNPQTNQPVAWSYSPTIQGFNNGLKGLSTGASRVVVIPPEQAYTQPGRETHQLYGDALVFFIDVVEIVDVPCPPEVPSRNACRLPA